MTRLVYDCVTSCGLKVTVNTWAEAEEIRRCGGEYTKRYEPIEEQLQYNVDCGGEKPVRTSSRKDAYRMKKELEAEGFTVIITPIYVTL